MIIYVAGPYRAPNVWEVEQNIRRAEMLAYEVWQVPGCVPLTPHLLGRHLDKVVPDEIVLPAMMRLLDVCDGLILVSGWDLSAGTFEEVVHARSKNKPIFASIESLRAFQLRSQGKA